ncbi:MAG: hypothetical protein WC670_18345 [Pseudolabrys sp.]|jgi:hypothetical protein
MMVYELARRLPSAVPTAVAVLRDASAADPGSIELLSRLFSALRAVRDCDGARAVGERLVRLAPRSVRAQKLVLEPCLPA